MFERVTQPKPHKANQKKLLDNSLGLCYNIRKDVGGDLTPLNTTFYDETKETILLCLDIVSELKKDEELKFFFDSLSIEPVLAGGAIRDLALDLVPNDYDIFFCLNRDKSLFTMDEVDLFDLFTYRAQGKIADIIRDLTKKNFTALVEPRFVEPRENANYASMESPFMSKKANILWLEEGVDLVHSFTLNFIFITDKERLDKIEKPLDIIRDFDYNLVKGYCDLDGNINLTTSFVEGFKHQTVVSDSPSPTTPRRIDNSFSRLPNKVFAVWHENYSLHVNELKKKNKKESSRIDKSYASYWQNYAEFAQRWAVPE